MLGSTALRKYCCTALCTVLRTKFLHLKKLQLLQNKAVRAICSLNWREHVTPCFDRPSFLKVRDVAKMEMAKFVQKSVHHSLPKYFQTYFHKVSLAHKRPTRSSSSDNLAIPLF